MMVVLFILLLSTHYSNIVSPLFTVRGSMFIQLTSDNQLLCTSMSASSSLCSLGYPSSSSSLMYIHEGWLDVIV